MADSKKRGPNSRTREQHEDAAQIPGDQISEVFEYWKTSMNKRNPLLDATRKRRIGWAIKNYGIDLCKKAIDGCARSDWHMGKNPSNKVYNDIGLIFRNAEKVEMFLEREEATTKKSAKDRWIDNEPF